MGKNIGSEAGMMGMKLKNDRNDEDRKRRVERGVRGKRATSGPSCYKGKKRVSTKRNYREWEKSLNSFSESCTTSSRSYCPLQATPPAVSTDGEPTPSTHPSLSDHHHQQQAPPLIVLKGGRGRTERGREGRGRRGRGR